MLPAYCVERLGRVSDDVELVKSNSRFGEMCVDAIMKTGDMSMRIELTCSGEPLCSLR